MSFYSVTKIHNDIKPENLKIKFTSNNEKNNFINITIKNVLNKV